MRDKIIAYDLGTGGNKASLYDASGKNIAAAFVPYGTSYPDTGWHEQKPADWWNAVVRSTKELQEASGFTPGEIAAVSISGHSLGCVPVDGKGTLLRESTPIWSDTRASGQTEGFFGNVDEAEWYMTTGNGFPPECYTVFKVMWYRDEEPEMFRNTDKIIGTKDYINYKLTGVIATDYSYASGSGVYDLKNWKYSDSLLKAAGIDRALFPEPRPSTAVLGKLLPEAAEILGFGGGLSDAAGIRVVCGGVDNSCMALGAGNIADGRVYTSLGSSSWIAVSSGEPVLDARYRPFVFTHVVPGMFTSAVSIFAAGSSLAWVRDVLCKDLTAEAESSGGDVYELMTSEAADSPLGSKGLLFNPSLAGGASQESTPHIRGAYSNIDLRHTRGDMVRAAMEGIALNLSAVLEILKDFTPLKKEMLMVGGGSKSPLWRQIFADAYDMTVVKTNIDQDAGSLGAAALGAVGTGLWDDFTRIDDIHKEEGREEPKPEHREQYQKMKKMFEIQRRQCAELGDEVRKN